ncbi:MAG: hypothetical protein ACI8PZ_004212 [Myxococcota bacterium]|jgi:hypothetical protein
MRTLVVGDVHGCADELAAVVRRAAADRVVLVGDLFTKGPDPVGVWEQIAAGGFEAVLGNHDARLVAVLSGKRPRDQAAARCVQALDDADPTWRAWVRALPVFRRVAGFVVVHGGLHPSGLLERTPRRVALNLRRWPEGPTSPRWHEVYTGGRRVIFGHDARGGLVRVERGGSPWLVGLDSGCVYGGRLTGWVIEDDVLVQEEARREYCPIKSRG